TTLGFSGPNVLGVLGKPRYDRLDVEVEGALSLGSRSIYELNRMKRPGEELGASPKIIVGGQHAAYRFTIFTAMGYVTSVRTLEPTDDRRFDAVFDLLWFDYDPNDPNRFAQALTGPTVFDLSTRFPLMIEGGRVDDTPAGRVFVTESCARQFLWIEFDRQFANLMNGAIPR
ncbi:MAG: hypothetical protein KDB80_17400, partial [Planctomycetes bacterium]|nr:hypothetical protein [Planctomycetota bacterium]